MRKGFEIGGFIAAAVLIAFGIGAIGMGLNARSTVNNTLSQEQIVGTPDMTPTAIKAEAKQAGLNVSDLSLPTTPAAGQALNNGARAHAFAGYMRIHALEATGGLTYAQMPRYATADGKGTNDPAQAVKVNGQPQDNGARQVWVTETARLSPPPSARRHRLPTRRWSPASTTGWEPDLSATFTNRRVVLQGTAR